MLSAQREEYERLVEEVAKHDRHYFVENRPLISDYAYDQLVKRLEKIEEEHPEWKLKDSPTQRVGAALIKGFRQLYHAVPMLSLSNTYSKEEVAAFIKRVERQLPRLPITYSVELKMDGVAISARYERGVFVRALTRGDGKRGDEITANLRTIRSLPLKLEGASIPEFLEVRGEVFMERRAFQELNQRVEESGGDPFANPRNATAGSLKLLDPQLVASRELSVLFYGVAEDSSGSIESQSACHARLGEWGLPIFSKEQRRHCKDLDEVFAFAEEAEKRRPSLPFEIDGVVVKVDEMRYYEELGFTGKSPRFAVAYKFAPEQAVTRVNAITVQIGRTGVLTPVAELEPVLLAGSTISRATLHNSDEVERKDVRVGDWVVIEKGGDVIPKVVEVVRKRRPEDTHPWHMPKACPACGSPVVHQPGEVAIRCMNPDCIEQRMRRLLFFASKQAMDIDHLGEKVIEQLVRKGFVSRVSDIYALGTEELSQLEGFKEKSIQNLLASIDQSRHVTLDRFILALGIKYVGEGTAELLALNAGDIETLSSMRAEELKEIEGIGEKTAQAVAEYFTDPLHRQEIAALFKRGVKPKSVRQQQRTDHLFSGKTFVLTGTLEHYKREEAAKLIKERGGKISGSVSKNSDYLLVGADPGSKLDKAEKLKVTILTEEQFWEML